MLCGMGRLSRLSQQIYLKTLGWSNSRTLNLSPAGYCDEYRRSKEHLEAANSSSPPEMYSTGAYAPNYRRYYSLPRVGIARPRLCLCALIRRYCPSILLIGFAARHLERTR